MSMYFMCLIEDFSTYIRLKIRHVYLLKGDMESIEYVYMITCQIISVKKKPLSIYNIYIILYVYVC